MTKSSRRAFIKFLGGSTANVTIGWMCADGARAQAHPILLQTQTAVPAVSLTSRQILPWPYSVTVEKVDKNTGAKGLEILVADECVLTDERASTGDLALYADSIRLDEAVIAPSRTIRLFAKRVICGNAAKIDVSGADGDPPDTEPAPSMEAGARGQDGAADGGRPGNAGGTIEICADTIEGRLLLISNGGRGGGGQPGGQGGRGSIGSDGAPAECFSGRGRGGGADGAPGGRAGKAVMAALAGRVVQADRPVEFMSMSLIRALRI